MIQHSTIFDCEMTGILLNTDKTKSEVLTCDLSQVWPCEINQQATLLMALHIHYVL